jgi:hypothetical protein
MSKYVNKNGKFNHGKWLREKSLQGSLNENAGSDFQKQFEFKADEFMETYLTHFEMMVDEDKMPRNEFNKLDKMWTSCKKTMEKMSDQLKKTSVKYL